MPHLRVGEHYLGVRIFAEASAPLVPNVDYDVALELLYDGVDYSELNAGVQFEVLEGPRVVGTGEVL